MPPKRKATPKATSKSTTAVQPDAPAGKKLKGGAKLKKEADAKAAAVTPSDAKSAFIKPGVLAPGIRPIIPPCDAVVKYASKSAWRVYIGPDGTIYDCMMNQTNINANNNKFYRLQILVDVASGSVFACLFNWGRVGAPGQNSWATFQSFEGAFSVFSRKFQDKTKCRWESRDEAVAKPGVYVPIEMDYLGESDLEKIAGADMEATNGVGGDSGGDADAAVKCELSEPLQSLMEMITDTQMFQSTLQSMDIDIKKMPLGRITLAQVSSGYRCLAEVAEALQHGKTNLLEPLSSKFYTLIPHSFGMRRPPVLNSLVIVKQKMELMETLLDMEAASDVMNAKRDAKDVLPEHPLTTRYKALHCDLQVVKPGNKTFKMIEAYVERTHGNTVAHRHQLTVKDIFAVERDGEKSRFMRTLPNRRLLWHGSRTANFCGILSQGLRIAPPEAPSTGYMFGKGIYFADMVTKSANYCGVGNREDGILLLCEVALGDMHCLTNADSSLNKSSLDKMSKHSTWGQGRQTPDYDQAVVVDKKVIVPCTAPIRPAHPLDSEGKVLDQSKSFYLEYNEFIVYDVAQVQIRYLVRCNFKPK